MRVLITGATGMIGQAVAGALRARGDQVVAVSRDPGRGRQVLGAHSEVHAWPEPTAGPPPAAALEGVDAVVNLLGEPIDQRWSAAAKRRIRESRVLGTRSLVAALPAPADGGPRVLVSQSATGYYGARGDDPLDERGAPGSDFLAGVVAEWEREATAAASRLRVALTRTGVVLSREGGALATMLPFFRLGIGGPVAGGHQYVPWVHIDDVVGALLYCLDEERIGGPVNVTAPNPVTNAQLSRELGRALRRPAVLPVPGVALRLLYGEMATVVTTGQRAVPTRLRELGYAFRYPDIGPALRDAVTRPTTPG